MASKRTFDGFLESGVREAKKARYCPRMALSCADADADADTDGDGDGGADGDVLTAGDDEEPPVVSTSLAPLQPQSVRPATSSRAGAYRAPLVPTLLLLAMILPR